MSEQRRNMMREREKCALQKRLRFEVCRGGYSEWQTKKWGSWWRIIVC